MPDWSCCPRLVAAAPRPHERCDGAPCSRHRAWPDAGLGKDGARPRRLTLGTLAACLRFRRQLGRCRRSPLLNVGATLAARSSLMRRRPADAGPVRSARLFVFFLGGRARLLFPASSVPEDRSPKRFDVAE